MGQCVGEIGGFMDSQLHERYPWLHVRENRWAAFVVALLALVAAGAVTWWYVVQDPDTRWALAVYLAGSADQIDKVVGADAGVHDALGPQLVLVVGWGLAVVLGGALGRSVLFTGSAQRMAFSTIWAGVLGTVLLAGANGAVRRVFTQDDTVRTAADGWAVAAQALTVTGLVLILPAVVMAGCAVAVTLIRWGRSLPRARQRVREPEAVPRLGPRVLMQGRAGSVQEWRANTCVPPGDASAEPTGICVSGGGIRSATVSLGAIQVIREQRMLADVDYLSSVSGGGYAAGALRLALQPSPAGEERHNAAGVDDVFAPGSPEFAYLRRHGRYLADGAGEWLRAVGIVARGLVVNLAVVTLLIVLAARLLGHFYVRAGMSDLYGRTSRVPGSVTDHDGMWWAVGACVVLGLVAWVLGVRIEPGSRKRRLGKWLQAVLRSMCVLALLVAVFGLGVPALAELFGQDLGEQAAGAGALATLVGYVATLVGIFSRAGSRVSRLWSRVQKLVPPAAAGKKSSLSQLVAVYVGLAALAFAAVYAFSVVVAGTGAANEPARGFWSWIGDEWVLTLVLALVLAFLVLVPDQIRWSLHPFYKSRLASAFAVRRLADSDGRLEAVPYRITEMTALETHGTKVEGFPRLILSGAAHVSGQEMSPPGRKVAPFTFSADHVGGPTFGWVSPQDLRASVSRVLGWDLTMQAAVAVSGAAFASAMGRHAKPFGALFALTNVRLGTWVPNPRFLQIRRDAQSAPDWWRVPPLPSRRRVGHMFRELFGRFPADGPLLLVSDGGHYENLGLVELLRLRCSTIFCIDASGDSPDLAGTLAEALTLAREELGVEVFVDGLDEMAAGSGSMAPGKVGLASALAGRLAASDVVVGTVHYPDLGAGLPATTGTLYVGKSTLVPTLPADVLTYAAKKPRFPQDPTGDQWFDHGQFDAYHALGRHIGEQLVAAYRSPGPPPAAAPSAPAPAAVPVPVQAETVAPG